MSGEFVLAAAPYHAQLTATIEQMGKESISSELERLDSLISDLKCHLASSKKQLADLQSRNGKQAPQALRSNSSTKRFVYKFTGRKKELEAKSLKKEQDYINAELEELTAQDQVNRYKLLLFETTYARNRLGQKVGKLETVYRQLDEIYDNVFAQDDSETPGPVWQCPEDHQLALTLATFNDVEVRHLKELKVSVFLANAEKKLGDARTYLKSSFLPTRGMYSFSWRNQQSTELKRVEGMWGMAREALNEMKSELDQAQIIQPNISNIPAVNISDSEGEDFWSLGLHLFQSKIVTTFYQTDDCLRELKAHIETEDQWVKSLGEEVEQAKSDLEKARMDLRCARKRIFEHVVAIGDDLPPEYTPT